LCRTEYPGDCERRGVNVEGCAAAVREVARELGLAGKLKIGIVTGDNIMDRIDDLLARGIELSNMDTGEPLSAVRDRIQSANAYLGAAPIVEGAKQGGPDRNYGTLYDTGLTLAPMIHEFGWAADDWNRLAARDYCGHIIECGANARVVIVSMNGAAFPVSLRLVFQSSRQRPTARLS